MEHNTMASPETGCCQSIKMMSPESVYVLEVTWAVEG